MAGPICELVSDLFYDGALRVASDAQASVPWHTCRRRALGDVAQGVHVHVHAVQTEGAWSAAERGPVRRESAESIAKTVARALASGEWSPHELIVLTPFRAQRARIRQALQDRGVETVKVSTVHRAQGSEAPAVLFDPVDGASPFLQTEEARRLINVALSRAQAKVLVYLSAGDAANPLLAPLVHRLRLADDGREAVPLQELARHPEFPANALGCRVRTARHTGEVTRVSPDGRQFWLVNERSGAEQLFDAEFWRAKVR